jgi:hypothetical protein
MKVVILNRKSGATNSLKLNKRSLGKIREVAYLAAQSPQYYVSVIAESADDVDLIGNSFHNIPIPAAPTRRASWSGDLAVFILANYPKDIPV